MKVAAILLLTQVISLLSLVAADDTGYDGGYIDYIEDYDSTSQSWIQSFFSWLSSFFYTTEPGELITSRPIQHPKYPASPYDAYASNALLPNYPVQYAVPQQPQHVGYGQANYVPSGPQYAHSKHIDGGHSALNTHPSHDSSYRPAATSGEQLQYPYFYKPHPSLVQEQHHAQPHQQGVFVPTSHQSISYNEHGAGRPSYTKQSN